MNLYEINEEIMSCVDEETGEIIDAQRLLELELEKNTKIENIGLWYKNLLSDAAALKAEIEILAERKKKAESKSEQLKALLDSILAGSKFETSRVSMFYRKSKAVDIDDDFVNWAMDNDMDEYLRYKDPEPNKTAIKEAILEGSEIAHARVVTKNNLTVR